MAFGYPCKHCGRDEQAHDGGHSETAEEMSKRWPSRRYSLDTCPRYELNRSNLLIERVEVVHHVNTHGKTGLTEWTFARHKKAIEELYSP